MTWNAHFAEHAGVSLVATMLLHVSLQWNRTVHIYPYQAKTAPCVLFRLRDKTEDALSE